MDWYWDRFSSHFPYEEHYLQAIPKVSADFGDASKFIFIEFDAKK